MSTTTLIRLGGFAAIAGGAARAITAFAPLVAVPDTLLQIVWLCIDVLLLMGVLACYASTHERLGRSGATAFVAALIGIALIRSSRAIPGVDLYPAGAFVFLVAVLGISALAWRTRQMSGWIPVTFGGSMAAGIVGTLVATASMLFVLSGVLFGAAFVGLGFSSLRPSDA